MPLEALPVSVPPAEAIEYFRRKGYQLTHSWEDVAAEVHARVFTVAKVARLDILEDIRAAVDAAIADGVTPAQFRRGLTPLLQEKGWWGRATVVDPRDGKPKDVQLGSPRRLDTIYDTNLRSSLWAGRWQQAQRTRSARPYARYVAILDDATRDQHRLWHGTVLPLTDPFWRQHWPPNGWRCRCSVRQLSDADLARRGLKVSDPPEVPTAPYENRRTGEVRQVPVGIDPGFDWNPGIAGEEVAARLLGDRVASIPADVGAAAWEVDAPAALDALERGYARWLAELGSAADDAYPIGAIPQRVVQWFRQADAARASDGLPPVAPRVAGVVVSPKAIQQLEAVGRRSGTSILRRLPAWLGARSTVIPRPRGILYDNASSELLYVYDVPGGDAGQRLVLRIATAPAGARKPRGSAANRVVGAELVSRRDLVGRVTRLPWREDASWVTVEGDP